MIQVTRLLSSNPIGKISAIYLYILYVCIINNNSNVLILTIFQKTETLFYS